MIKCKLENDECKNTCCFECDLPQKSKCWKCDYYDEVSYGENCRYAVLSGIEGNGVMD